MELRECLLPFSSESSVFQFLSKNIKIKTYKNIILFVMGMKLGLSHLGGNTG
jgi:hypothetical protein